MSKTTNKFIQVTLKITFITLVVLGTFLGIDGAGNFAAFMAWVFGLISIFVFITLLILPDDKQIEIFREWKPILPSWLAIGLNFFLLMIMVWHGWIATSIIYSLEVLISILIYAMKNKYSEETVDSRQS